MTLPQDSFILLSYINTKLRDEYSSLEELCSAEGLDMAEVIDKLTKIGFAYDKAQNAFK